MQFSTIFLAAAAATLASAVKLTNPSFEVTAGTPFNITWSDAEGPVTLTLKNGPSTALTTVSVIGSGLSGGAYSWTPPATLDSSLYAIEITDSTNDPNYSVQFQVSGATASASTVTASSTSASSSGTSSSASASSTASSTSGNSSSTSTSSSTSSSSTISSNSTSTAKSSSSASKTSSLTSSASKTSSSSSSSSSSGTSTSTSAPTSSAADIASPLAFVFLAFAAIMTLN